MEVRSPLNTSSNFFDTLDSLSEVFKTPEDGEWQLVPQKINRLFKIIEKKIINNKIDTVKNLLLEFHSKILNIQEEHLKSSHTQKKNKHSFFLRHAYSTFQESIYKIERFLDYFEIPFTSHIISQIDVKENIPKLSPGIPLNFKTTLFPLMSKKHIEKIKGFNNLDSKIINNFKKSFHTDHQISVFDGRHFALPPSKRRPVRLNFEQNRHHLYGLFSHYIGEGCYKSVYLAFNVETFKLAAFAKISLDKVLQMSEESPKAIKEKIIREINIHKLFSKDTEIVQIYHSSLYINSSGCHIGIMMEYCNKGDLEKYILKLTPKKRRSLNYWNLIENCLTALKKIEEKSIYHRDIKPSNIFLHRESNGTLKAKIGDFGFATTLKDQNKNFSMCGTPYYLPPECIKGFFQNNPSLGAAEKGDIWAFGQILYMMRLGPQIHQDTNDLDELYSKILNLTSSEIASFFKDDSDLDGLKELNMAMLTINPFERPTASKCLEIFKEKRKIFFFNS